jgi:hypothetical protein
MSAITRHGNVQLHTHTTQSPKSEDLADDQRYLLGLLHIAWAQLFGGEPDSRRGGRSWRTCLVSA